MNYIKAFMFIIFFTVTLNSKSIWIDRNIYSSDGNFRKGDVLIVKIKDISKLDFSSSLNNNKTSSVTSTPDVKITGFLPKVNASDNIKNNSSIKFSEKGNITLSIPSEIIRKNRKGKYIIKGNREYSFDSRRNIFTVTGVVDPKLIDGRMINSSNILNFKLEVFSTSRGYKLNRPKFKKGDKADTTLTEKEQYNILVKYLEKILKELIHN